MPFAVLPLLSGKAAGTVPLGLVLVGRPRPEAWKVATTCETHVVPVIRQTPAKIGTGLGTVIAAVEVNESLQLSSEEALKIEPHPRFPLI